MKKIFRNALKALVVAAALLTAGTANAQYGQIVNQFTNVLGRALSGGFNYKGYVEAKYIKGIGANNGDFTGISTSQGVKYGDHFFMGVGLGVDLLMCHVDEGWNPGEAFPDLDKSTTKKGCVVPLFTDFRFIAGNTNNIGCQIGLKLGCSFLLTDSYITVNRGYITSSECFFLMPSVGVRIPTSINSGRQAVTFALAYQLITPSYRYHWGSAGKAITLNGFGLTCSYEW